VVHAASQEVREADAPLSADASRELEAARRAAEAAALMGGEELMDPADFLSSPSDRAWCLAFFGATAGLAAEALAGVDGAAEAGACAAAAALAWWLSDLGTGVFHWSVDNYGSAQTPLLGGVIDAFQGHHKYPWTIVKRQFCNNVHKVAKAPTFVAAPLLLVPMAPVAKAFACVFLSCVVLSQQFHAWSHTKKSELPAAVVWAQEAGILLSRKAHGAHHKSPFAGNYCIVSGWWNEPLDNSGFFLALEKAVLAATGVAPRCWTPADFEVQEEAPEGWGEGSASA